MTNYQRENPRHASKARLTSCITTPANTTSTAANTSCNWEEEEADAKKTSEAANRFLERRRRKKLKLQQQLVHLNSCWGGEVEKEGGKLISFSLAADRLPG